MKTYDAYLFDWDGTLTMTHDVALEIIKKQLERYGIRASDTEIVDKAFGRYHVGMVELGVPHQDLEELGKEIHAFLKENMPLAPLYPNAERVLRRLHAQGGKLALVTATYREIIDIAIARHGFLELFDVIVTGDEVKAQKPDPDGLIAALKALGISPDRAVMLGDSKKDILAGKAAGTDTLLFYPAEHETQHDLQDLLQCNPTYMVQSWQQVLDTLQ
jgi:pyrophosphatase PpaX